jgi:predicted ABC-type sugar transport system permease subunit
MDAIITTRTGTFVYAVDKDVQSARVVDIKRLHSFGDQCGRVAD